MKIKKIDNLNESAGNNKYNFIDKEKAFQALVDGFCVVYSDKYRELFTKVGSQLLELGMENGKAFVESKMYDRSRIHIYYEFAKTAEDKESMVTDLKKFFTDEQVQKLLVEYKGKSAYPGNFMDGCNQLAQQITDEINEDDITFKEAMPFDYFKQFKLSKEKRFDSVTMYSESGLGLNEYKPKSMRYMEEEGESFYAIESIGLKFHYLGQMLQKQETLKEYIEKSIRLVTTGTNRNVVEHLKCIVYEFALGSVADQIVLDIQKETGSDEFLTHDQVSDRIKNFKRSTND